MDAVDYIYENHKILQIPKFAIIMGKASKNSAYSITCI